MLPVTAPPRVNIGVVVPQYGIPLPSVNKNADVEAELSPVPPLFTGITPEIFEELILVNPDPLPVNVLEPILILPKPEPIEPEVTLPTVARFERLVIVDVASDDTRPFVENKRPFNEEARFVEPVTLSAPVVVVLAVRVPVAVTFAPVISPVKYPLPATVRADPGVVVPIPILPPI